MSRNTLETHVVTSPAVAPGWQYSRLHAARCAFYPLQLLALLPDPARSPCKDPFYKSFHPFPRLCSLGEHGEAQATCYPLCQSLGQPLETLRPANISALIPSSACKRGESRHCWEVAGRVRAKGGRPRVQCWSWPPAQDACSELS